MAGERLEMTSVASGPIATRAGPHSTDLRHENAASNGRGGEEVSAKVVKRRAARDARPATTFMARVDRSIVGRAAPREVGRCDGISATAAPDYSTTPETKVTAISGLITGCKASPRPR